MEKAAALLIFCIFYAQECEGSKLFSGLFPNWAQYRESPYAFSTKHLQGIVGRLDHLLYAHAYFSSDDFQVSYTDPRDKIFIQNLMYYKTSHPQLKVLVSIGGDNFPSKNFSEMVSSNESRTLFISSLQVFLVNNEFDGVNINWKWPCSLQRSIYERQHQNKGHGTCDTYTEFLDKGSECPQDSRNFLSLLKEMRQALGNTILITVTGSPFAQQIEHLPTMLYAQFLDYFYVESYGYAVSAANKSYLTAPIAPLNHPPKSMGINIQSINSTVKAYLEAGVPAEKLILGIPVHGNLWYAPGTLNTKWEEFGIDAAVQGKCCGPYRLTFGAKPGLGSQECGVYLYSEIQSVADMRYYYDKTTQTAIGYVQHNSIDGWTEGGTWFSYNDRNSVQAITQFIKQHNLAGAFASDVSGDTINYASKQFTFELMGAIYSGLQGGGGEGNICNPAVGCNVCNTCCRTYLTNQFDCDACVTIRCSVAVCYPKALCNVCSSCCSRYFTSRTQCNLCVWSKCKN